MLISIRNYPLCDGTLAGGMAASDFRLRVTRTIDVVLGLRQRDPNTFDRGIRTSDLTFSVTRTHSSAKAAEIFEANQEQTIPQSGSVQISSTSGETIAYLLNGRLIDFHLASQIGSTTVHAYHIVGGIFDETPTPDDFILTEPGDFVLLESGDKILLEM